MFIKINNKYKFSRFSSWNVFVNIVNIVQQFDVRTSQAQGVSTMSLLTLLKWGILCCKRLSCVFKTFSNTSVLHLPEPSSTSCHHR